MTADPYAYWRAALNGDASPPENPQPGFWRMDKKGLPVAIWYDGDELQCLVNGEDAHAPLAWRFCAPFPITEEVYDDLMAGEPVKPVKSEAPPIKSNQPDLDGFDALRFELEAEIETAEELLRKPVKDQADANQVGIFAKRLAEIEARAEARRVIDKEPYLVGGREVDAKWKPVTSRASTFASRLKAHLQTFLMLQKAAERAKADAAAAEAAAKWAAVQTIDDEGERAKVVAEAQAAEEAAAPKRVSAGRTGMKVGLRSEKRARIVDYDRCLAAVKDHPDVKATVETLAQRSVRGGNPLPGVEVVMVERVV